MRLVVGVSSACKGPPRTGATPLHAPVPSHIRSVLCAVGLCVCSEKTSQHDKTALPGWSLWNVYTLRGQVSTKKVPKMLHFVSVQAFSQIVAWVPFEGVFIS